VLNSFFVGTWFPRCIAIVKPLELAELAEDLADQWDAIKIRWHCSARMLSALVRNSSALSPQPIALFGHGRPHGIAVWPQPLPPAECNVDSKNKLDVMFLSMRYQHHPP
jgi:hypothetical protein